MKYLCYLLYDTLEHRVLCRQHRKNREITVVQMELFKPFSVTKWVQLRQCRQSVCIAGSVITESLHWYLRSTLVDSVAVTYMAFQGGDIYKINVWQPAWVKLCMLQFNKGQNVNFQSNSLSPLNPPFQSNSLNVFIELLMENTSWGNLFNYGCCT